MKPGVHYNLKKLVHEANARAVFSLTRNGEEEDLAGDARCKSIIDGATSQVGQLDPVSVGLHLVGHERLAGKGAGGSKGKCTV